MCLELDEDLSAECWGVSYLFHYNDLHFLVLLHWWYLSKKICFSSSYDMCTIYFHSVLVHVLLVVWMRIWKLAWSEEEIQHNLALQLAVLIVSVHCSSPVIEMGNAWMKCMDKINLFQTVSNATTGILQMLLQMAVMFYFLMLNCLTEINIWYTVTLHLWICLRLEFFPGPPWKKISFMSRDSVSLYSSKYWKYIHQMTICHDIPSLRSNRWFCAKSSCMISIKSSL